MKTNITRVWDGYTTWLPAEDCARELGFSGAHAMFAKTRCRGSLIGSVEVIPEAEYSRLLCAEGRMSTICKQRIPRL